MRRNKRCLLAYHRTRTDRLEELVWKGYDVVDLAGQQVRDGPGGVNAVPGAGNGDSGSSSLSPQEEDYVRQYSDLLAAYKGQWTDIDLTGSLEPPRDLFIDVRVLKDAGEIQTEYGYDFSLASTLPSFPTPANRSPQSYHFNEEQPVLRSPRRRRTSDSTGLSAEVRLKGAHRNHEIMPLNDGIECISDRTSSSHQRRSVPRC